MDAFGTIVNVGPNCRRAGSVRGIVPSSIFSATFASNYRCSLFCVRWDFVIVEQEPSRTCTRQTDKSIRTDPSLGLCATSRPVNAARSLQPGRVADHGRGTLSGVAALMGRRASTLVTIKSSNRSTQWLRFPRRGDWHAASLQRTRPRAFLWELFFRNQAVLSTRPVRRIGNFVCYLTVLLFVVRPN